MRYSLNDVAPSLPIPPRRVTLHARGSSPSRGLFFVAETGTRTGPSDDCPVAAASRRPRCWATILLDPLAGPSSPRQNSAAGAPPAMPPRNSRSGNRNCPLE